MCCRRVRRILNGTGRRQVEGLVETSPGVRSVMVEYDPSVLPLSPLLALLRRTDVALPVAVTRLPSRVVKLPIAFGDRWTRAAIDRCAPRLSLPHPSSSSSTTLPLSSKAQAAAQP